MHLVIYWNGQKGRGKMLFSAIKDVVPPDRLTVYHRIEDLCSGIRQMPWGSSIMVLLASNTKELAEIIALKGLFLERRIVLILPDRKKENISRGHTLYPRFLSYMDSDFRDVRAVLNKMIGGLTE